MNVVFVAYGPIKEVVEEKEVERELSEGATVDDLLDDLRAEYPELEERLVEDGEVSPAVSLTVDGTSVDRLDGLETKLSEGDEVRAAPPVHGGEYGDVDGL